MSAQQLVAQLGDANFQRRVAAERQLLSLGTRSIAAVSEGLRSSDFELRLRSARLLDALQRRALSEYREHLARDPWAVPEHFAPGWIVFQSLVGDGDDARRLYVEMIAHEPDLMLALLRPVKDWTTAFEQRCGDRRAIFHRRPRRGLHPASAACLLFLATHPESRPSPAAVSTINGLIGDSTFVEAVRDSRSGDVLQALLEHWITDSRNSTPQMRLALAARFHLPAGVQAARELMALQPSGARNQLLQNAILFLAKYEGTAAIGELRQLLDDESVLYPSHSSRASHKGRSVQIRDVALLGLIHVTGQDPADYGYRHVRPDVNYLYRPNTTGFENEGLRQAAFLRWRRWSRTHLKRPQGTVEDASEGYLF